MNNRCFYNVRMRASQAERHISGAERIVNVEKVHHVVAELLDRAMSKCCQPDQISIKIEQLENLPVRGVKALDVLTISASTCTEGRSAAAKVLRAAGVSPQAITNAVNLLSHGAGPSGENMRGAMIMDSENGERIEPDTARGIRASRFDWDEESGSKMRERLADKKLFHFRTYEAIALAAKIAHGPGVVAELCWSDDPDYTAGYVASLSTGYIRFPYLKEQGINKGGRTIFINRKKTDIKHLIHYLEKEPVIITEPGVCSEELTLDRYLRTQAKADV